MLGPRLPLAALALAAATVNLVACDGDDEETAATEAAPTTTAPEEGATGPTGPEASNAGGSAHIDEASGDFAGLTLDERRGEPPPKVEIPQLDRSASAAGCRLELGLPDEGNQHIPPSREPSYDTNPPTSGPHDPVPLADGAYLEHPDERYSVHSLEHGRIVIQYDPELREADQLALKGVFDDDPEGMVLIPSPDMPYEVAAAAWRNGLGCKSYSPEVLDAIRAFRDEFRERGPEKIPL